MLLTTICLPVSRVPLKNSSVCIPSLPTGFSTGREIFSMSTPIPEISMPSKD